MGLSEVDLCNISSVLNCIVGLTFLICIIIYDILNPDRDNNKESFIKSVIEYSFFILLAANLLNLVPKIFSFLENLNNKTQKKLGLFVRLKSFLEKELMLLINFIHITFFVVGFLYIIYKPNAVWDKLFWYLVCLILFFYMLYIVITYLSNADKEVIQKVIVLINKIREFFKLNTISLTHNMAQDSIKKIEKKMSSNETIMFILFVLVFNLFLMLIFSWFEKFEGSLIIYIIKLLYIILLSALCVGFDGKYLSYDGGCNKIAAGIKT